MDLNSVLIKLFVAWVLITLVWLALLIYRSVVGRKEEDQVFLTSGEERLMHEQEQIALKLKHITPFLTWTGIFSLVLLLVVGALWIYQGLKTTM